MEDKENVLRQEPWNFKGSLMILQEWSFLATFWVQIHGLILGGIGRENAILLGSKLGKVESLDDDRMNKSYLWVKIKFDADRPLQPGFVIPRGTLEPLWISFKYECLPSLCSPYGRLDHTASVSDQKDPQLYSSTLEEKN